MRWRRCSPIRGPPALERIEALDLPVHWVRGNGEREVAEAACRDTPAAPDDLAAVTAGFSARDAAAAGRRMVGAGWPDERSIRAALIEPVEPLVVTEIFEDIARAE